VICGGDKKDFWKGVGKGTFYMCSIVL